jgi:hypothetical protein
MSRARGGVGMVGMRGARHLMLVVDDRPADALAYAWSRLKALLAGAEPTPRERRALLALWRDVTRTDGSVRARWEPSDDA